MNRYVFALSVGMLCGAATILLVESNNSKWLVLIGYVFGAFHGVFDTMHYNRRCINDKELK